MPAQLPEALPTANRPPVRIAVVGLGQRSMSKAIKHILCSTELWDLAAVCDPDAKALETFRAEFPMTPCFSSSSVLLATMSSGGLSPIDAAYVAVPHCQYTEIIPELLHARVHVLKEKPAASSSSELEQYQALAEAANVRLVTASQSRHGLRNSLIGPALEQIGPLIRVEAVRTIPAHDLSSGWRASRLLAGGGALIDIGWHLVDSLSQWLSDDELPTVQYSKLFITQPEQGYDSEDTAQVVLSFSSNATPESNERVSCNFTVSRLASKKENRVVFVGEHGILEADCTELVLKAHSSRPVETVVIPATPSDFELMMANFHAEIAHDVPSRRYLDQRQQDMLTTKVIERIYEHANSGPRSSAKIAGRLGPRPHLEWPLIYPDVESTVTNQLHTSISIYSNGGIIGDFENAFKVTLGVPGHHALLHNSGTNALQALFYSAGFGPEDEVIFPVYTFHATCSPAMHFGIRPIFCDALPSGNISPECIRKAISPVTKAIVITHMWGMPCDMPAIMTIMKQNPRILLFEDCSHAHGARVGGQVVGTYGDGAVWSLQGQKIVSGGEGGILVTRHAEFYHRALIWGHYNKRCLTEVPVEHKLRPYARTGAGLKHRVHPIAAAIMLNQLGKLDSFLAVKSRLASIMTTTFAGIAFLETPTQVLEDGSTLQPAWYAYVVRFKELLAPHGLTRDRFVHELEARGLDGVVDIPVSTGLLHREALFTDPAGIFPHLYGENAQGRQHVMLNGTFPEASDFYAEAVKFTVFSDPTHEEAMEKMIAIVLETAQSFAEG